MLLSLHPNIIVHVENVVSLFSSPSTSSQKVRKCGGHNFLSQAIEWLRTTINSTCICEINDLVIQYCITGVLQDRTGHYMDDRRDRIITAGQYELADDYHARILNKVSNAYTVHT